MRVLVLGSGAREHALARNLVGEGHAVTVAPGNPGIAALADVVPVDPLDGGAAVALAARLGSELVVIGPEAPLAAGVADALRAEGVAVFGPGREAARIETSKAFAKRIMAAAGVPTGGSVDVRTADALDAALDATGPPYVVKADGLAAGKGVLVTDDRAAAGRHALRWLETGPVLVEEHLRGREVSLFFVSDGSAVVPLSPAQDAKRLRDGDEGPNTGGMGAYSPLPWLDDAFGDEAGFVAEVERRVARPVVDRLAAEGTPFVGLLYCGLIVDGSTVSVIEFNARFGDPETQVVLPRITDGLGELLHRAAAGTLGGAPRPSFRGAAVGVVLASDGYPDASAVGRPVRGIDTAEAVPGVHVDHAATAEGPDGLVSAGGRVLTVVGVADDLSAARAAAYRAVDAIGLPGGQHRTDIAGGTA